MQLFIHFLFSYSDALFRCTSSIVQIMSSSWSFEKSKDILRNQKFIIGSLLLKNLNFNFILQNDVKVSMVLKPKHTLVMEELLHNVSALGYVLNKLITMKTATVDVK